MFDDHGIAGHEVRPGDTRQLVVRKVPGLDTEDHADRAAFHMRLAACRMQFDGCQKFLGVLGVVGKNARREFNLAAGFGDALAHFQRHCMREGLNLRRHQLGRLADDFRTFRIALVTPDVVGALRGRQHRLEVGIRNFVEALQHFAVGGIDCLIAHDVHPRVTSHKWMRPSRDVSLGNYSCRRKLGQ
jgi:hypothetical protein